jgi:hypothetical protein
MALVLVDSMMVWTRSNEKYIYRARIFWAINGKNEHYVLLLWIQLHVRLFLKIIQLRRHTPVKDHILQSVVQDLIRALSIIFKYY